MKKVMKIPMIKSTTVVALANAKLPREVYKNRRIIKVGPLERIARVGEFSKRARGKKRKLLIMPKVIKKIICLRINGMVRAKSCLVFEAPSTAAALKRLGSIPRMAVVKMRI